MLRRKFFDMGYSRSRMERIRTFAVAIINPLNTIKLSGRSTGEFF
jgi:hypothetical protein